MVKVKALNAMTNVLDNEIGRYRKLGEEWSVSEERAKILLGENSQNKIYVEVVEDTELKSLKETPKKKIKKREV